MSTNSSMDQLLDLLIDALEERKSERGVSPPESLQELSNEIQEQPILPPISVTATTKEQGQTALPKAWRPYAAAQNIYSMEAVTADFIKSIQLVNPQLLRRVKVVKWQAVPDAALVALSPPIVRNMVYSLRLDVERRIAAFGTVTPLEVDELDAFETADMEPDEQPVEIIEGVVEEAEPLVLDIEDSAETETPIEETEREITQDNLPRTLTRMFIGLILVVVLANLKIVDYGAINSAIGAAGNSGSTRVTFARDGMLLRAENSDDVYLMENNKRRWITTPEAFREYGYRWGAIRVVSADYLEQFEVGRTRDLLVSCPGSPHIYTLSQSEEGSSIRRVRHHIQDEKAFVSGGFKWEDINYNYCSVLSSARVGESIPADPDHRPPNPQSSR